jgi:hypothetical protein
MRQSGMATGAHNEKSEQIAVRVPRDLLPAMALQAGKLGSKGKAIVAAMREAWGVPEPERKPTDKAA